MSALDSILERMPVDRRQSFIRTVHAYGIAEDSPDLIQAAIASEAVDGVLSGVRAEREKIERALESMPEALKAAASPIASSIADSVRESFVDTTHDEIARIAMDFYAEQSKVVASLIADARKAVDSAAAVPAKANAALLHLQEWSEDMRAIAMRAVLIGSIALLLAAGGGFAGGWYAARNTHPMLHSTHAHALIHIGKAKQS
jgi:hypothetical protein